MAAASARLWASVAGMGLYLDAASGLPLNPAGHHALLAALDQGWADPARLYRQGRQAGALLAAARESVAAQLGLRPAQISFTSGLEAALFTGLAGLARARARAGRTVAMSAVEHSALFHAAATSGLEVHAVPVSRTGAVDLDQFLQAARGTAVAVLQAANHEVGTCQPVTQIAENLGEVPLLMDAHQVIGRSPIPTGWSVLAASARHWGGPNGVGLVAIDPAARFSPATPNDGRESGRVSGLPNVPNIVAAAAALEYTMANHRQQQQRLHDLVERIRHQVPALIADVEVVGDPVHRLPHIVTFSCLYVDGEALLSELDKHGIAVSSGSACTSDVLAPSHVLVAMGVLSHGNVRVSLPHDVTDDDINKFLSVLPQVVEKVRKQLGAHTL